MLRYKYKFYDRLYIAYVLIGAYNYIMYFLLKGVRELSTIEEPYWTLGKASEYLKQEKGLNIPVVTLRTWFNALEKYKVHTLSRTEHKRERVLFQLEIDIVIFWHQQKELYGKNLSSEFMANAVQKQFEGKLNYYDLNQQTSSSSELVTMDRFIERVNDELDDRIELMKDEMRKFKEELYQEFENRTRLALPDPKVREQEEAERAKEAAEKAKVEEEKEKERQKETEILIRSYQVDIYITEMRLKNELKREAEEEWAKDPAKVGFIIKREDTAKKVQFINDYVDKHLPERMEEELKK